MTDGEDANARDDTPDSATAIAEMRPLVGSFGDVEPADMDERPYIHAFNELDLRAARSLSVSVSRSMNAPASSGGPGTRQQSDP
jgi:hypothetical protein